MMSKPVPLFRVNKSDTMCAYCLRWELEHNPLREGETVESAEMGLCVLCGEGEWEEPQGV